MAEQRTENRNAASIKAFVTHGAVVIGLLAALLMFIDTPFKTSIIQKFEYFSSQDLGRYASGSDAGVCTQVQPLLPQNKIVEKFVRDKVESKDYHAEVISKLSKIIQIPSESYDDLGPIGTDPRWDIFYEMEKYIKSTYPTVFEHVKLDHANTHGLILTWEGSISPRKAKPILMLAHQDVVPVLAENVPDWTHPPYAGHYDGKIIWGRGSTDDKGYLISIIESLDLLVKSGFKPSRTVILAFGCDEEISGENCARPISDLLLERYGDNGIYLIMDEGSSGVQESFNQSFAMVSVAEKGYVDVGINVTAAGGHASNPPDHNAIGIISEIVVEIENNPFHGKLTHKNPIFPFLECAAVHVPPNSFPDEIRNKLGKIARGDEKAQKQVAALLDDMRYYFRTSQSVGKINGGVKINAIPEAVSTMINLRLAVESSVGQIERHFENLIKPIAKKYNMTFEGFQVSSYSPEPRKVTLFANDPLEPAPVSPSDAEAFQILSGTIRHTLNPLNDAQELIVTPYLMPANTDTKFYWALTENIYRFTPINLVHNLNRAHTTDEFIRAEEFVREPLFLLH